MKSRDSIAVVAIFLFFATTDDRLVEAGPIVVSGDTNIVNPLVGSFGQPVNPGNEQFFQNVLGGGSTVVVQGPTGGGSSTANAAGDVNSFYSGLGGVTSSIDGGAITAAELAGADLFVGILPDAYSGAEITALSNFEAGGGTILLLGENNNFSAVNANINALLAGLGSGLLVVDDIFDGGFNTATGGQIAAHPLTAGVASFVYAAPSRVTGGTTLFFGSGNQPFVAVEGSVNQPIPEPESIAVWSLLLLAGMTVVYVRRRRLQPVLN